MSICNINPMFPRIVDDGFNFNQFCEMAEHSFRDISNATKQIAVMWIYF